MIRSVPTDSSAHLQRPRHSYNLRAAAMGRGSALSEPEPGRSSSLRLAIAAARSELCARALGQRPHRLAEHLRDGFRIE